MLSKLSYDRGKSVILENLKFCWKFFLCDVVSGFWGFLEVLVLVLFFIYSTQLGYISEVFFSGKKMSNTNENKSKIYGLEKGVARGISWQVTNDRNTKILKMQFAV